MVARKYLNFFAAIGIIVIGYLLRDAMKQQYYLPVKSSPPDLLINVTLLGTNDLHSQFEGLGLRSYPDLISGGYSKLVGLINAIRVKKSSEDDIILTLDAGDWYSGSLFDNLGADPQTSSVPQMEFFHAAQYDAIILGNHDFDRYESALFTILDKADKMKLNINVLVSNILPLPKGSKFQQFYEHSSSVKFLPYLIKENKVGKVGVLGYTTSDALFVSTDYRDELQFVGCSADGRKQYKKLIELATEQSVMLKKEHNCDIVVVVIHGGHKDEEDVGLLNLPDIDIVLGGHTHELYLYSADDSSLTSQCGYAGMQLTALSLGIDSNKKLHFRGVDEEYRRFVSDKYPQCIYINNELEQNSAFERRVQFWKKEIKDLNIDIDPNKIVFKGDLTPLLQPSTSKDGNAKSFAHMLVVQFNKWEQQKNSESDPVTLTLWNNEFLKLDQFVVHDLSDVMLTFDDVYSLIFYSGTKDLYTFYLTKRDMYIMLQGNFILRRLFSPLVTQCIGGVVYSETTYCAIPLITDIETVDGVPYKDWPEMVRIVVNGVIAPYFFKNDKFTLGLLENFPKDKNGNPVSLNETVLPDSPTELDLFMNYLESLSKS